MVSACSVLSGALRYACVTSLSGIGMYCRVKLLRREQKTIKKQVKSGFPNINTREMSSSKLESLHTVYLCLRNKLIFLLSFFLTFNRCTMFLSTLFKAICTETCTANFLTMVTVLWMQAQVCKKVSTLNNICVYLQGSEVFPEQCSYCAS